MDDLNMDLNHEVKIIEIVDFGKNIVEHYGTKNYETVEKVVY